MESIEVEYAKVVKRQKLSSDSIKSSIDKLIFSIESAQQSLTAITTATAEAAAAAAAAATVSSINNPPPPPSLSVDQITVQLASKVKDLSSQVSDAQKEFYNTLGKFCKWLDKQKYFKTDLNDIWDPQAFIGKEELIYDTLATHFIREGRFSCCEVFLREAGILQQQQSSTSSSSSSHNHREELREKFKEMYRILEALKNKDLTPAITWARSNRAELQARGSSLEFEMHRAHFISLMTTTTGGGKSSDLALKYAKENLGDFSKQFSKEIQRLMCSFLFKNRLANSPYSDFLNSNLYSDIQRHFTRDFSLLLGLSPDSPLYLSIMIGTSALPTMIKMSAIMKGKSGLEWSQQGELPVEIPLLDTQRYHSVFACPVSKEQGSEENPPMMMACGHVIAKESLNRLSKGTTNTRFKCPYCPMESTSAQAIRVFF